MNSSSLHWTATKLLQKEWRGLCVCFWDTRMSTAKTDKPIDMPAGKWTRVSQSNHTLSSQGSRSSNRKWNFWKKHNVGFSPHTVYQRSDWRAAEADGCHIKFSAMKHPPPAMRPLVKILQAPVVCYSPLTVQSISSSSPGQSSVPSHFWEMWRQGASWPRHW